MNAEQEAMLDYVSDAFIKAGCVRDPKRPFRDKLSHTRRVIQWAEKISEAEGADTDLIVTAAIFHDVGYTVNEKNHPAESAVICRSWLLEHGWKEERIIPVERLILNHGNKQYLKPDTEINLLVLIEADNLEEKGALDILWDAMEEGRGPSPTYEATSARIKKCLERRRRNIMVTPTARRFWQDRVRILRHMVAALEEEL